MKEKMIIKNVTFGSDESCTFTNVNSVTTATQDVQLAAFGRKFPRRTTTHEMLNRIDDQIKAMEAWKFNLLELRKQVIKDDYEEHRCLYQQYLTPEEHFAMFVTEVA